MRTQSCITVSESEVGNSINMITMEEFLSMSFFSRNLFIVLAYHDKFGTKKKDSEEDADAEYILEWYMNLPQEEKQKIAEKSIKSLKEYYEEDVKA